ncbi:hypothetical protein MLD38_001377 [Melastoma candidum]|uniref:Uncharacterized protein n=1 Tax=Melastoma candidum TaxID=119954 RepID=A0ACB9SCH6_9MYRT|nr:hypothetical protein MLD38_001377 [Melastoma candidum]
MKRRAQGAKASWAGSPSRLVLRRWALSSPDKIPPPPSQLWSDLVKRAGRLPSWCRRRETSPGLSARPAASPGWLVKRSSEQVVGLDGGLSGSSAIVCADLNCLLDIIYNVRHLVKVEIRPNLVLNAEEQLGIVAGLRDRVAEGQVHSTVRQRWLNGGKFIISNMEEVSNLALEGRNALLEKDYSKFTKLVDRNFDLRRTMFGDECLGDVNIKMGGGSLKYQRLIEIHWQWWPWLHSTCHKKSS